MEGKKAIVLEKGQDGRSNIVASGSGRDAEEIINKAREKGVQEIKDPDLEKVYQCADRYKNIPEEAYMLLDQILTYIYTLEKEEELE